MLLTYIFTLVTSVTSLKRACDSYCQYQVLENTLETSGKLLKLHSKRVGNFETTLETSGKHLKLHSKRVGNIWNYTRNECIWNYTRNEWVLVILTLRTRWPFLRTWVWNFQKFKKPKIGDIPTRFECIFHLPHSFRVNFSSSPLVSGVFFIFPTRFECIFHLPQSFRVYYFRIESKLKSFETPLKEVTNTIGS